MITNLLEKTIQIRKPQFEKFILSIFKTSKMERLSLDLDAISFRTRYMIKHGKDLSSLPLLQEEFTKKALELRNVFGITMRAFMDEYVGYGEFNRSDLIDVLAEDVKMDSSYITFTINIISNNIDYLNYADKILSKEKIFNLYPNEYFRFYSDSYNDGIAKAYPELFEKEKQNIQGEGADQDIFVHSFTFQTSENCSLSCTYCVPGDTKILMNDFSYKNIEDIQIGDMVRGFPENGNLEHHSTKVTKLFKRQADDIYKITSVMMDDPIYITGEHPILTSDGWVKAKDLQPKTHICIFDPHRLDFVFTNVFVKSYIHEEMTVYNFETESHTYVANNLAVHNCYQINKSPMKMTFDIAKKFVDDLLHDKYDYINQHNSPAIILEFIGGEPLLEIDLTRKIYEYFLEQCYELNHPWFTMHRISICSNGLQYFNPNVQSFFKEYSHNISFNISIDGNKKLHDACRIQPNGEGSYDIDMMALQHYTSHYVPDKNSKMTLAPGNIKYLFESVKSFMENGMKIINLNCVFEPGWTTKHAAIEYEQLKELSNYILENDLEDIYISIFNERPESVGDPKNDQPSCFKAGTQVATPNGHKNIEDVKVGDILYTASGSKHRVVRMVKKHSKDNCKIKATGLFETHLTKDHKVFAKKFLYMGWKNTPHYSEPGFYPISELRVHDRVALPLIDFSKGVNEKWMTEDLCYLIGVYIADGYTHKERITITPGYDEDKYYYNLLCRSGLKFTIGESRTSKRYSISRCSSLMNKQFYDICQTVGHGAHRKHFSSRILRLSKKYLIKVLYGYLDTDGCEMHDGYRKVNTVSPHLASDLMLILRSIGEYPTCYLNKREGTMLIEGRTVNVRDRYEVYFKTRNRNNHHRYKYDERLNLYWVRLNSIEDDEEYDVYCPTVVPILPDEPEEHTIIINGALAAINCGGSGKMLALRANGEFYPCLRYMPSSVSSGVESLQIGDVSTGPHTRASGSKVLHKLDRMTRRSGMTDLCFECPISSSCGGCLAVGHQIIGTPDRKTTFHCVMKYAEALANWYYFNNLIIKHPNWDIDVRQCKLPKNRVLKIISEDEYEFLKYLEIMAIIVKMEYHNKGGESS